MPHLRFTRRSTFRTVSAYRVQRRVIWSSYKNSYTENLAIRKRPNFKRETTSSPKVGGNNDKENVALHPSKHRQIEEPTSSLSSEVRSLRYIMQEMVKGQREMIHELKRIGRCNEDGLARLNSTVNTKL
ncbi:hypothetical protein M422DRAFT_238966 [Sphaerobolus stellatus SS14]|nr:hypothetical protein M422DRAFT_238966 [Sphaerobolus stellatus SS14]